MRDQVTIDYHDIKFKYSYVESDPSGLGCIRELVSNDEYKLFKYTNRKGVFIDIGGNHGVASIILAIQNPHATIYVLEPYPELVERINNNIKINSINNVIVIDKALGDNNNTKLSISNQYSGAASTLVSDISNFSEIYKGSRQIEVETISFDHLLKEYNIDTVELLKIDCEGGEYYLYDSTMFKQKCVKNITGEFHNLNYNLKKSPEWNTTDLTNFVKKYVENDVNLSYLTLESSIN